MIGYAVTIPKDLLVAILSGATQMNANFDAVKTTIDALEASRTKYYSLSMWAAQKSARSDFQGLLTKHLSGLYYSSGSNFLDIPIHLPYGANIEEIQREVYDTNATANIEVRLYQGTLNSTLSVGLGSVASSRSSGDAELNAANTVAGW